MPLTAEQIEQMIGRRLRKRDVLVAHHPHSENQISVEVTNPFVPGYKKYLDRKYPGIETRELIPQGPASETEIFERKLGLWDKIVKEEDRTDHH